MTLGLLDRPLCVDKLYNYFSFALKKIIFKVISNLVCYFWTYRQKFKEPRTCIKYRELYFSFGVYKMRIA